MKFSTCRAIWVYRSVPVLHNSFIMCSQRLTHSDQWCTYLLLTVCIIPLQLMCNFSQSYHSQHLFCEVLLSPDTEGRMSDTLSIQRLSLYFVLHGDIDDHTGSHISMSGGNLRCQLDFPVVELFFLTILAFFCILLQHRVSTSKLYKSNSFMKAPSCTKNIQWSALGGNKMVMKVLGDKVNQVTVTRVGGNRTAQYLPTTSNKDSCTQILWD